MSGFTGGFGTFPRSCVDDVSGGSAPRNLSTISSGENRFRIVTFVLPGATRD